MTSPILITGAGQRVGLALTQYFIKQKQPIIISYKTRHGVIDELISKGVICIQADFSNDQAISDFIEQVKQHTDSLRAIIHNASNWDCEANNANKHELFDNMMRIHAKTPYLINLALEKLLLSYQQKNNKAADIINFTDYVVEKGSAKHIAYAASKATLDNLTKSFAAKYAPKIKVNAIAPALIAFNNNDSPEYKDKAVKKSLMAIEAGYQEIINSVTFLLDSGYITGRSLPIDGGRHLK